jgi:hypothetical protein
LIDRSCGADTAPGRVLAFGGSLAALDDARDAASGEWVRMTVRP